MAGRPIEQSTCAPIRAMLDAAQRLESIALEQERRQDDARSIARSTRVLIKLMEGWCIEYAVMNRLVPISQLRNTDGGNETLLDTLRERLGLAEESD